MSETHTENFDIPVDDIEKLRDELIALSEQGEINFTKTFLNNRKKCTETVMKKIMSEYVEKKKRASKMKCQWHLSH